jgi:hypothetical protein
MFLPNSAPKRLLTCFKSDLIIVQEIALNQYVLTGSSWKIILPGMVRFLSTTSHFLNVTGTNVARQSF